MKLIQIENTYMQLLLYICRFKLEAGPRVILKFMSTIYAGSFCEDN